ncbi:chromate resistance protein ChrB domain-containing protein [Asticcacaulis sp. W401b]|uniref:chromate resistance protein ChrB domain-containing protein n=1 Tax=Asticcacaulis sp. W401b TaxID=3388666 RepID=UPI003970FCDD
MRYLALILSLPTENATLRMRLWRTLKGVGAAALRDGVYLLPDMPECRSVFDGMADEVNASNGTAYVLTVEASDDAFVTMFDRREAYETLVFDINETLVGLTPDSAGEVLKAARKLRKSLSGIVAIDYFPAKARDQAHAAIQALELQVARALSPDEPHSVDHTIIALRREDYRGRGWATRSRPWVDRLASAWLIRRFIDESAQVLWLTAPAECPDEALGFDFDGATFTHVGARVTFEVLVESFGLNEEALRRIGGIVRFLDVGGLQPPEATGVESVLKGLRDTIDDDDKLLAAASMVFDGLLSSFQGGDHHG